MSSSRNWVLLVRKRAYRQLAKFSAADCERIMQAVELLPDDPFAGDIEKMEGEENSWRRRIGSYRIFFELIKKDLVIYITEVKRRTSSTY